MSCKLRITRQAAIKQLAVLSTVGLFASGAHEQIAFAAAPPKQTLEREDLIVDGRPAFIIAPTKKRTGATPWLLYAPTLGHGLSGDAENLDKHNPIDRLASLAKARVPIFHIHGDVDKVVPLDANSGLVAKRYNDVGGTMVLKVARGQGHNMWKGFFECQQLVDFVIQHATIGEPVNEKGR